MGFLDMEFQLIPGLPDDVAMECLIRVPLQFHSTMKSVCHSWQHFISNPSFYHQRRKSGFSELLIFLVQPLPPLDSVQTLTPAAAAAAMSKKQDKLETESHQQQMQIHTPPQFGLNIYNSTFKTWKKTDFPGKIPMFCQCLALPSAGKLLVLGGWDSDSLEPVADVYILDLAAGFRWRRGASMSVARSFFACAVVGESQVYVAGGHDRQKNALSSAEVYDIERNEWRILPNMIEERDECHGLAFKGDSKFWVVSGYGTDSQGQFKSDAEYYDPESDVWHKIRGVWPFSSTSPREATTVVSFNKNEHQWWWFLEEEEEEGEPIQQNDEEMKWKVVRSNGLPESVRGKNPFVMSIENGEMKKEVFVMGGKRRRRRSQTCNGECDSEGTFTLISDRNGSAKWNHIHTPPQFSGFPFSASYVTI